MSIVDLKEKVDSFDFDGDVRGMIGIGTLIVFIAMVIVAAVAAGVLIQTSGKLQEQARATGEETIRQVSSGVKAKGIKGWTDSNRKIENIEIVVGLRAGSQGINLKKAILQYTSENQTAHLEMFSAVWDDRNAVHQDLNIHGSDTDNAAENVFVVNKIVNKSDTQNHMLGETGDVAEIWISTNDIENQTGNSTGLPASTTVSLNLMPAPGFQTYAKAIVPQTLSADQAYEL